MILVLVTYCFSFVALREYIFWGTVSFRHKNGVVSYSIENSRTAEIYGIIKYRGKEYEFTYITTAKKVTDQEIWDAEGLIGEIEVKKVKAQKISSTMEKEHNFWLLVTFIIGLPVMVLISIGIADQIDEKFEERGGLCFND